MAVGDLLERVTWSRPDRVAIVGYDGAYATAEFARLTYVQADRFANQIAASLLASGMERGDRVLMCCDNSVEAVLTRIGIAKAGLVAAPINPMMAADMAKGLIETVEPAFAIVDGDRWHTAQPGFAAAGLVPRVSIPTGGIVVDRTVAFSDWIAGRSELEPDEPRIAGDDVWELMFTSGTTSLPKASMGTHTFSYLTAYSYALSLTRGLRYEHDLKLGTFLPIIYHCGHNSAVFPAFLCGGTAIIGRRVRAPALAHAITREGITALWAGAPPLLQALADAVRADPAGFDLHSLTVAMFSWQTLHPDLLAELKELCGDQLTVWEIFGQTESMSGYRFWLDEHPDRLRRGNGAVNYVGLPNPILGARIVDPDGNDLRDTPGVAGEAVYRGPALTAGYFRDEAATSAAFEGGWFRSGDSCQYEEDGLQLMVDRYKDVIKSGGETVSSMRVETVVARHPAVVRAAVIGLPHPVWGEMVTAVVVARSGADVSEDGLIAFCRERLAGFETPKRVVFAESMPETVGGKILKQRLRNELSDGSKSLQSRANAR
jgi:acyl-CoA synthetase (AMP-forming)/AMP-acid ligase II